VTIIAPCPKCGTPAQADLGIDNWLIVRCRGCGKQPRGPLKEGERVTGRYESNAFWRTKARVELDLLAKSGMEFSADDITAICGVPDEPNAIGAMFAQAHKQGLIRPVGTRTGDRPDRHSGSQRIWVGK